MNAMNAMNTMSDIPEGERIPHIYPTEFWTEPCQMFVKKPVKRVRDYTVIDDGLEVVKQEEITVMETEARVVYEDFVKWRKKGDTKTECVYKVRVLQKHDPVAWAVVKPFYDAWKKGEEAPKQGIPLTSWQAMKKPMVEKLKLMSIYTVEDFAKLEDSILPEIGPDARKLREQAKSMISMNANLAQFAAASQKRDEEMAEQNRRIEELTAQLASLKGQEVVKKEKRQ